MPKYVIEGDIPGAGKLSAAALQGISAKRGGFPANRVSQVREIIDPTTAEK